jgi:DNA-binding MarR family transcriptional regulator
VTRRPTTASQPDSWQADPAVADPVVPGPGLDGVVGEGRRAGLADLDQAGLIWTTMRELVDSYPAKFALRQALNLGRGSGRVKALLSLAQGPLSLSELAEAVQVDAPYATLIADTLEERDLVERRPDPADRRRKIVALTPEGKAAAARARQVVHQPPPGFGALSPAELETLAGLMRRIAAGSGIEPAP